MSNKTKQRLKAIGAVMAFYGTATLVAIGILSIPKPIELWIGKHTVDIFTGGVLIIGTYYMYRAALDYIEWKEMDKGDRIL